MTLELPGNINSRHKRRGTQALSAVQICERDRSLLCDLFTYGAMLRAHIQALYFPSRRRCNQRLKQLHDARLLARAPLPFSPAGLVRGLDGTAEAPLVYRLGSAGVPLVAAKLEWDIADVRRLTRLGTPTALAHTLEIVNLRLQAEREPVGAKVRIVQFLPERLLRHGYEVRHEGGAWRREVFKPDALLEIEDEAGERRLFFLEVDLGHTSSGEWQLKAEIAARYRHSGLFARRYGLPTFSTLVCTTGKRRRNNLRGLLARHLSEVDAAHFLLTTFTDIAQQGLFAPVWHTPGREGATALTNWNGVRS